MSVNPLVSVLIPAYNVEDYIEIALNSILNQSYKNIEVIVVDDCSVDETFNILTRISKKDSRVKVFKNKKNIKIVKTLNYGIKQCNGEYILRMDGDDISDSDRIYKLLDFLEKNRDYSLVGSGFYSINETGDILGCDTYPDKLWKINSTLRFGPPILHIWLVRTEVYLKLNGYRDIPGAEDYDFLLRMKSQNYKFINIKDKLYSIRLRSGNSLSTMGYEQRLLSIYAYGLFLERKVCGIDSYSERFNFNDIGFNLKDKDQFIESVKFLNEAILCKSKHNYLKMILNLIKATFCSKIQRKYILNRVIFKIINKL